MSYQALAIFAQSWGMIYIVGLFAIAVGYALWPSNKTTFDRAARMPLDEEMEP